MQGSDEMDRLLQHHLAHLDGRPPFADDMLVEVLAGSEAEGEPTLGEDLQGRSLLRDHRGVVPHRRAGDVGHQLHRRGRVRDGAQHRPCVRRMALAGQPRREVIAGDLEVETGILRGDRVPHKLSWSALLGHQRVPESCHDPHGTSGRSTLRGA
jgi:hypothetical protein